MSDIDKMTLRLGGAGGKGPVEVVLWHDEGDYEMTTLTTAYPDQDIEEIDLTKLLRREGYEIVEAV